MLEWVVGRTLFEQVLDIFPALIAYGILCVSIVTVFVAELNIVRHVVSTSRFVSDGPTR